MTLSIYIVNREMAMLSKNYLHVGFLDYFHIILKLLDMALFKEIKLTDADRYPHDLKILRFVFLNDFHNYLTLLLN